MEWLLILLITISGVTSAVGSDSMSADQYITDGETIVSADESFELGFFSPGNSKNRYLGIWFKKIAPGTVVWVANREKPIHDSSGLLKLTPEGILILTNSKSTIWSSNSSTAAVNNPVAQLLDTGNLIVRDGSNDTNVDTSNNTLWQSFDYPGNTFVAGMKLGRNIATGLDRFLSSWKNPNDPSQGFFTYKLDHSGLSQLILGNGSVVKFRSGPWNGVRFSGFPQLANISGYIYGFVSNQYEEYYYYEVLKGSATLIMVLNEVGLGQCYVWIDQTREWFLYFSIPPDDCDTYALCGAFGTCNTTRSSKCSCVEGFAPKSPSGWKVGDWSSGCIRRTELDCHGGTDKFFKHSNIKLPDTRQSWFDRSMSLVECERTCLRNCSCTAYSVLNISDQSGCLLWFNELFDIREFTQNGQEIFVRIAGSEVVIQGDNSGGSNSSLQRRPQTRPKIIVGSIVPVILLLGGVAFICIKCTRAGKFCGFGRESQTEDLELPMFDFGTILNATENFLAENKLGQGGYGPVYKGVLKDGQEIAVKRLSENSRQGLVEFKNEVMYIAKLQHRNLVKLLGCCIQEDEKLLVYEFLPNKKLGTLHFQFDEGSTLDWPKRFVIINGIALGLLYLHRDSRLRIIHRDLKAENILLDNELNPKISDFGLARSFGGNESEANTKRVVGTYGYMSPEYAIHGLYSTKSDVFSFGVLVMEIVHGKRNRGFTHPDSSLTLLGHAWTLFKGGRALNLMDETIISSCNLSEVLRSIHVALLCVQNNPKDRPEMSSVVMMLGGESVLPEPKHPGFFTNEILSEGYSSSSKNKIVSANELTISYLGPR